MSMNRRGFLGWLSMLFPSAAIAGREQRILTVDNTLEAGCPVRIYDGNDEEITRCVYANPDTGEVLQVVCEFSNVDIARVSRKCKLPLRVVPVGQ